MNKLIGKVIDELLQGVLATSDAAPFPHIAIHSRQDTISIKLAMVLNEHHPRGDNGHHETPVELTTVLNAEAWGLVCVGQVVIEDI